MAEFVVRIKEVHVSDIIVDAENEEDALRKAIKGDGERGSDLEKIGYMHPRTWEIFEL